MEELVGPLTDAANVVTVDRQEALDKLKEYKAALKVSRSEHDRMMKAVYTALSEGLGIINPHAAILKAGIDQQSFPKLAICRADFRTVFFKRFWSGNGNVSAFSTSATNFLSKPVKAAQASNKQFVLQDLPTINLDRPSQYWNVVKAMVPIIPPEHRPSDLNLSQYCILWEVDKWEALPRPPQPPGDPMLLKRLGQSGLYAVMAWWNLSDIEKLVLGSMLGR
jgi:hypothetical protein